MKLNSFEQDNDWAYDLKSAPIHISKAKSGAQGYYCIGCTKEMQAVKKKNVKHKSYFRHHVIDVDNSKIECVHASREYRERLAYFHFQREKQITVPEIYKYPPKGVDGCPLLISEKRTIKAAKIVRELTFYENENGEVLWGKNPEIEERFLLIRPDATFFDDEGKPILFLEFVVTHKLDEIKKIKLQRLGIDTVQIIVPKKSEEEIVKAITKVSNIKWTYNEIESNTNYISVSQRSREGIPSIDEIQRKLFEESYGCRTAQIGNLIRTISRCLESQSYRGNERLFEREIQRIEKATKREQSRLDELQSGIESEVQSEFGERRNQLDEKKQQFQKYNSDLEKRYFTKRENLEEKQENTDREIEFRQRVGRTESNIRKEFGRNQDEIRREFDREEGLLIYQEREIDSEENNIRRETERIAISIRTNTALTVDFRGEEERLAVEFGQVEDSEQESFNRTREEFEAEIASYRKLQAEVENAIRSDFERQYYEVVKRIDERDVQSGDELSERIESILGLRRFFDSYAEDQTTNKRYRKYQEIIRGGTWKKW